MLCVIEGKVELVFPSVRPSKLDPRLLTLLCSWDQTDNPPSPAEGRGLRVLAAPPSPRRVATPPAQPAAVARVFLETRPTGKPGLTGVVSAAQVVAGLWTATIPIHEVQRLAGNPSVRRATLARRLRPLLDRALPRVHVPEFRAGKGLTGRSVIVGVIDSGIDGRHAAFAGRILTVWDQTRRGLGVPEGRYGVELTGANLARARDTDGHGTHVAGIAAGSHPAFGGVATASSLVIVRSTMDDTDIADAVRYVFRIANDRGMPAVVNLSLGGHDDGHDGSDLLSRVIDEVSGPGRIVCCAAGNEGDDNIHGITRVTRGEGVGMRFQVPASSVTEASLTGWYAPASVLEVAVRTPEGKVTPFQRVIAGDGPARRYRLSHTDIIITTPGPDPGNGDYNFRVTLRHARRGHSVRGGIWQLRVRLVSGPAATLHVWTLDDADFPEVVFTGSSRSDTMKIGSPGSASRAVTVGSFTTRTTWTDSDGNKVELGYALGRITSFSSEGPLRNRIRKPDVIAPGAGIASALSRLAEPDPEDVVSPDIVVSSGTSMASPFVAGLVALMLEGEPELTPEQVKRRLRAASRIPGRRRGAFDNKWGYGLVDADRL
jgi:subtilisin family serine protease